MEQNSSLSRLNEDCLIYLFKFLELKDLTNLAKTYPWLLYLAQTFCVNFKNIAVREYGDCDSSNTLQEFCNIMRMMGKHVVSVSVQGANFELLAAIQNHCPNLTKANLDGFDGAPIPFNNLKELTIYAKVNLSKMDWKSCFRKNLGIEIFQCTNDWSQNMDRKCVPYLRMLKKLHTLTINHFEVQHWRHICHLTTLRKFSFSSNVNANNLLTELGKRLHLVELEFYMPCDADTFSILKSFLHLEILSIHFMGRHTIAETFIFPAKLKRIQLLLVDLSCSVLLSLLEQLQLLEELELNGTVFLDNNSKYCYQIYMHGS